MPRPISATISLPALSHNLNVVRQRLTRAALARAGAGAARADEARPDAARPDAARPDAARPDAARPDTVPAAPSIWAVIKANAYGHGIERAVRAFAAADGLAMLDLDEAVRCREAGWAGPILLLEGCFDPADLQVVSEYQLGVALHRREQLDLLARARLPHAPAVWLKINTGMNRLGFPPDDYAAVYAYALELQQQGLLGEVGKMTHFANADGEPGVAAQWETFQRATATLPGPVSVANSAATLRYPQITLAHGDQAHWVRPGCCLYGVTPFADTDAASLGLLPAMALRSKIIGVQDLRRGDEVGYGGLFRADAPMRVGVVACGYADGYPRHAVTGTPVVVAGVRTRVLGRVSMDMLVVDLAPVPGAGVGSPVSLWGGDGPAVDEVANAAGTIGYELVCALAPRVPVVVEH